MRFTIEHKSWEGCLNFYGIIPEGAAKPVDGHRLLNDDALIDWLTELKGLIRMQKRKASTMDSLLDEPIHMPGFPQLIVTRYFCYHWLKECGWPLSGLGFGSLDYLVFAAPLAEHTLTDEAERNYWLAQVRHDYLRGEATG